MPEHVLKSDVEIHRRRGPTPSLDGGREAEDRRGDEARPKKPMWLASSPPKDASR
jgi:hypothetical protein